jgi:hypothetical protein
MAEERDFGDDFVMLREQEGGPLNVAPTWCLDQVAAMRCCHGEQEILFGHPFQSEKVGYSSSAELTSSQFLRPHTQQSHGLEEENG